MAWLDALSMFKLNAAGRERTSAIANVCVLGGGPAGLAAAIAVAQSGCRATLVDHATPPVDKACGEGLMPDSIAALHLLGVTVPFEVGYRFRGIRFADEHSSVAADFPNGLGTGVRRAVLHGLLVARAQEVGVECLWGVRHIQHAGKQVTVDGRTMKPDLIIAADGQNSATRQACGLDNVVREHRRYGFRRHYRMAPWSHYMELHWGPKCQIYITPVASDEVCVVAMSRSAKLRIDEALQNFPALQKRISNAEPASRDRGALSVTRKLRRVYRDGVALVGDASGSVDAITGEGLCLAFKQALSLAAAIRSGNLDRYQKEHTMLSRRPHLMSSLMLTLDKGRGFQRRALAGLALHPGIFQSLLAVHVGEQSFSDLFSWQLVHFCRAFLEA